MSGTSERITRQIKQIDKTPAIIELLTASAGEVDVLLCAS